MNSRRLSQRLKGFTRIFLFIHRFSLQAYTRIAHRWGWGETSNRIVKIYIIITAIYHFHSMPHANAKHRSILNAMRLYLFKRCLGLLTIRHNHTGGNHVIVIFTFLFHSTMPFVEIKWETGTIEDAAMKLCGRKLRGKLKSIRLINIWYDAWYATSDGCNWNISVCFFFCFVVRQSFPELVGRKYYVGWRIQILNFGRRSRRHILFFCC